MLSVDVRSGVPGASGPPGSPQPLTERQGVPPKSLIVRVAAKILEATSLCTYFPGRPHLASDGKTVIYTELEKVDCHGQVPGCTNYPTKEEPPKKQDPPPQQQDS